MKPLKIGIGEESEVIVGFCNTCGSPCLREEVREHEYRKGEMVVISCGNC